tara:strand:- start:58 stop:447 length:390 start_codon:yes stop_codon:yes gene_type:complete
MRRSASEIIRNLEGRIARLERQSSTSNVYETFEKLTLAQLSEIRKAFKSRRIKLTSATSQYKQNGAGLIAEEVKQVFLSNFSSPKEVIEFIEEYLDSIIVTDAVYKSQITGKVLEKTYKLYPFDWRKDI